MSTQLSIRILRGNPNHHLWNNNGTWWLHYTIHRPDYTKARVRQSLDTALLREAQGLRDKVFRQVMGANAPVIPCSIVIRKGRR